MGRQQRSKRAREHRKQAVWAFGQRGRFVAHPSHIAYRKNRKYTRCRKDWRYLLTGQGQ